MMLDLLHQQISKMLRIVVLLVHTWKHLAATKMPFKELCNRHLFGISRKLFLPREVPNSLLTQRTRITGGNASER
jgi:hypothetical protein